MANELLRKELDLMKEENSQLTNELSVKNNLIEQVQIAIDKVQIRAIKEDIDKKRLEQTTTALECQTEELQNELLLMKNEKNQYMENNFTLLKENETLKFSCSVMEAEVERLNSELQNLLDKTKLERKSFHEINEESLHSQGDSYLNSLEDEVITKSEKLLKVENNLMKKEIEFDELRIQYDTLLSEDKHNESHIRKYKEELINYSENHKYDNSQVQGIEGKMKKLERDIEENVMILISKDSEISKLKLTIQSTYSENDQLDKKISDLNNQVTQLKMALEIFQFIMSSPSEFLKPSAIEIITREIESMNLC